MPARGETNGKNDLYRENRRRLEVLKRQGPREVYGVLLDGERMELWYIDRYGRDGWRSILSTKSFEEIVQAYIDARIKEGGAATAAGPARPQETLLYEDNRKSLDALQKQRPRQMHGILLDYNQMETWYVARYGMDGWHQILSTKPLEQIIQDYVNEQLKAQKARNAHQASAAGSPKGTTTAAAAAGSPIVPHPDEDDDILYVPFSTLTEQELLDEQERRDTTRERRQEINDTLKAIQAAREQALEEGLYFGEETAQDIAERMRGSRGRNESDNGDSPTPVPIVVPEWGGEPGIPGGPGLGLGQGAPHHIHHGSGSYDDYGAGGPAGDHSMDFDPFLVMEGLNDGGRDTGDGAQGRDTGDGQQGRDTGSGARGTSSGSPARSDGEDDGAVDPVPPMYGPEGAAEGELPPRPESSADNEDEANDDGDENPSEVPHISGNGLDQSTTPSDGGDGVEGSGTSENSTSGSSDASEGENGDSVRNVLNDGAGSLAGGPGSLLENNPVADAAKQAAKKKMRLLVLHALSVAAPFIIGLLFVVMVVACINDKLGGGDGDSSSGSSTTATMNAAAPTMDTGVDSGGGGSSAGSASSAGGAGGSSSYMTRKQSNTVNGLPRVYIDPDLEDLFRPTEEEEDERLPEYPAFVATFFASNEDWTDTLYASDDCQTFQAIGTVPNEMRDPCIMFYEGRFWVITCLNDEDGHLWLMVSSSEDLKTWVGPTQNGPFSLDQTPRVGGALYDVVAPEWFLDDDGTIRVIVSCGYWGGCHGEDTNDFMEAYMLEVSSLKMSGDQCQLSVNGPARWMSVNADGADRIDGTIDRVDGAYYLTIKRNGLSMELWQNSSLSPSGWTCLRECSLYGFEAPCVFEMDDGSWRMLADGVPDIEPYGTRMWQASSIFDEWVETPIRFLREDGSQMDVVRHGTVLPVKGGGAIKGFDTISESLRKSAKSDSPKGKQQAVINACHSTPATAKGWCAQWVINVYSNAGIGNYDGDARDWYRRDCTVGNVRTDPNFSTLKPGMVVAVSSSSSGTVAGEIYGHVGIYIGGGKIMHCIGSVETWDMRDWVNQYGQYVPTAWGYPAGMSG